MEDYKLELKAPDGKVIDSWRVEPEVKIHALCEGISEIVKKENQDGN